MEQRFDFSGVILLFGGGILSFVPQREKNCLQSLGPGKA